MKSYGQVQLFSSIPQPSGALKGLFEVADNIVDMLDADRKPDIAFADSGRELLLRRKLGVGGGGRMDRQGAGVADIGDVVDQLKPVDEGAPGIASALQFEPDQPAIAALQIGVGAPAASPS